jgi:hypothetical protein
MTNQEYIILSEVLEKCKENIIRSFDKTIEDIKSIEVIIGEK